MEHTHLELWKGMGHSQLQLSMTVTTGGGRGELSEKGSRARETPTFKGQAGHAARREKPWPGTEGLRSRSLARDPGGLSKWPAFSHDGTLGWLSARRSPGVPARQVHA